MGGGSSGDPTRFEQRLVSPNQIRRDAAGDGRYGTPRGDRRHNGIDLIASPGHSVAAPFPGKVARHTKVYSNPANECQRKLTGIVISGTGDWEDYELKVFYLTPSLSSGSTMSAGKTIGHAQNVAACYAGQGMKNHIHIELRKSGRVIDPTSYNS